MKNKNPRLVGAIVVTDMRLCYTLFNDYGWVILHHEMWEAGIPDDPNALHHQFVVLGIPEGQTAQAAEKLSRYDFTNVTGAGGQVYE